MIQLLQHLYLWLGRMCTAVKSSYELSCVDVANQRVQPEIWIDSVSNVTELLSLNSFHDCWSTCRRSPIIMTWCIRCWHSSLFRRTVCTAWTIIVMRPPASTPASCATVAAWLRPFHSTMDHVLSASSMHLWTR